MVALLFLLFLASLLGGLAFSVVQTVRASEDSFTLKPLGFFVGLVPTVLFFSLYLGGYTVDAGSMGVVKRNGRIIGTLEPGLHFVRPVGDTVTSVAVQRRVIKVSEPASTSDLQIVNAEVTLGYHVDGKYADFILAQLNDDAEQRVITPASLEAIKAETSQYEALSLVKQREQVRAGIENRVRARLGVQHVILEDVSITNLSFSSDYEHSIEQKQVAEQNAEKARNVLVQTKIEAEQAAAEAKGKADARIAQATGEAQSIILEAKAKAQAQELQKANITPELIQIRTIELLRDKWDGSFPQFYMGAGKGGVNPALLLNVPTPTKKGTSQDNQQNDQN